MQSDNANTLGHTDASRAQTAADLLGREGTGWEDHPESRAERSKLAQRVAGQQRLAAERNPSLMGRVDRAQHQKQLLGAYGSLVIDHQLPSALRVGPLSVGGTYKAAVRFSNGQPCPFRDQAPDVRGVGIKFFAHDGNETDMLMTNEDGRSHARTGAPFLDFSDILLAAQLQGQRLHAFKELARALRQKSLTPYEAARGVGILLKATSRPVRSCALETYVGSPVHHGQAAIRHVLRPHASTSKKALGDMGHANYLRQDLEARLRHGALRFELGVQVFQDEQATPVNDASIAWKAPFVRVGELVLHTRPSLEDETLINRFAFNPAHGFGSLGITHVREDAYRESAKNRGAASTEEARQALSG